MSNTIIPVSRKSFYANAYLYFTLALLVIFVGFLPSYFGRFSGVDKAHHFHGITSTLWMLLLIIQPLLYRMGKIQWHRRTGRISFVLVPLVLAGGFNMIHIMLNKGNYPPGIPYQIAFIDFILLPVFLIFYLLAIYYRKQTQYHARYMACTVMFPLLAGLLRVLFRFPFVNSFSKALNGCFILVEIVLLVLLIDDKRSGKIRPPYVIALLVYALVHLLMNFAHQWAWWRSVMDAYASLHF
jgi:predicted ferric reductase